MRHNAFIVLLLLAVVLLSVKAVHAQRSDSRPFEHLWTLYDGIPQRHLKSQQAMLDTIVLEYDVLAAQYGDFSAGATTVECIYAPEWRGQSTTTKVKIQ